MTSVLSVDPRPAGFQYIASIPDTSLTTAPPSAVLRAPIGICSSLAPGQAPYLATVSVPAGLLEDDPGVRPRLHVFTASKAPWWEIHDDLPQHREWVPGYEPKR